MGNNRIYLIGLLIRIKYAQSACLYITKNLLVLHCIEQCLVYSKFGEKITNLDDLGLGLF